MEMCVRFGWVALALVHVAPAAAGFLPNALSRLYGVAPGGDLGLLLRHRAALFLGIVVLCLFALYDPGARGAAAVAVTVSVLSFLLLYIRAGLPRGALRAVAVVDALAIVPLALVSWEAWSPT